MLSRAAASVSADVMLTGPVGTLEPLIDVPTRSWRMELADGAHMARAAAMPYFWQSFGLAEAVEERGDLYLRSEIHRHLGFHYLAADVWPHQADGRWALARGAREAWR
jgi:hypothetical protein